MYNEIVRFFNYDYWFRITFCYDIQGRSCLNGFTYLNLWHSSQTRIWYWGSRFQLRLAIGRNCSKQGWSKSNLFWIEVSTKACHDYLQCFIGKSPDFLLSSKLFWEAEFWLWREGWNQVTKEHVRNCISIILICKCTSSFLLLKFALEQQNKMTWTHLQKHLFYLEMKRGTVIQLFANEIILETAIRIPYLRCQMLQTWLHWLQAWLSSSIKYGTVQFIALLISSLHA